MPRSNLLVFTLVFVCALALYAGTAAPSLTWAHDGADGGDLIAAAVTNGVPHPPGYPTYVTLGQIVGRLPVGDVAYRFHLFSAACMALAASFTALTIRRLIIPFPALPRFSGEGVAIVASLFFVTAPMVWGQATIAEAHALNASFVALIVFLVSPIVFRGEAISLRRMMLAAWLWGIAFGNSLTVAALAPVLIVAWWRRVDNSPAKSALPVLAFLIGLSMYALIPLRAAQQPPINWGDAASLDRFIALITAEMYRGYALSTPPADLLARLVAFAQLIVRQYGWVGVILGAIGIYFALVSPNKTWRWLAVTLALYSLFALTYSAADSALYLIPVWMFGAWAIARGLLAMTRHSTLVSETSRRAAHHFSFLTRHFSFIILLLTFLLGPALNVLVHFPAMNLRDDHAAAEFASAVLIAAPSRAIVVTEADGQTFALWYHRHVLEQRPDLGVVDRRLAGYPWYAAMLRAQGSAPLLPDDDPPGTWIDRLAELNPDRALCAVDQESAQMACRP